MGAMRSAVVSTRFFEAITMVIPPAGLLRPDILFRVLRYGTR
jgi:hypothetical protein